MQDENKRESEGQLFSEDMEKSGSAVVKNSRVFCCLQLYALQLSDLLQKVSKEFWKNYSHNVKIVYNKSIYCRLTLLLLRVRRILTSVE